MGSAMASASFSLTSSLPNEAQFSFFIAARFFMGGRMRNTSLTPKKIVVSIAVSTPHRSGDSDMLPIPLSSDTVIDHVTVL